MDNPFEILGRRLNHIEELILKSQKSETVNSESDKLGEAYIDQKKVSELLGVSSVTIWDWEKKGLLLSYRIGNLKRFKLSEVLAAPKPIRREKVVTQSVQSQATQ
ncbi:hypothetical protein DYBT9623_00704 [Dyadobacter sp. CECT 9623]|uniref:Helix-turn-helix domain-containing protein n=1 Tax=Dyadobacter linearis TaxID=2823330 RepID=A0ABM8UKH3_9BACT|nr:hypothetical protein [Dyadobacter sp. CECT 9623]CAG5067976.1 hypothetical protein DYBT9623_00704 [Dyadobacter sp. CECT 9623]